MEDVIAQVPSSALPAPFDGVDDVMGFRRSLRDLPREHGFEPLRVEGRIPEDLVGTLLRNGPAVFSPGGQPVGHWFDAYGAITALRFGSGRVEGAVRTVRPTDRLAEEAAGHALYAGFGGRARGLNRLRLSPRNCGNTNVLIWQGRLFAQFEAGRPIEIAPADLQTLGDTDLEGLIPMWFSAHHHRVEARKTIYNFGMRIGLRTSIDLFALPDRGPARRIGAFKVDGVPMLHDFIATEHHLIFFVPPLRVSTWRELLGLGTFGENLQWRPELGTEIIVVPIDAPEKLRRFRVDPFYLWHFANAEESPAGGLVIDLVRYPDARSAYWLADMYAGRTSPPVQGLLSRVRIEPGAQALQWETLWDRSCEFPGVDSRRTGASCSTIWVASHQSPCGAHPGFSNQLARIDLGPGRVTTFADEPGCFVSEPTLVPRPGGRTEDDAYVLSLVYDARQDASFGVVFDAQRLEDGPLARVWFDHHVPIPLHGGWMAGAAAQPG